MYTLTVTNTTTPKAPVVHRSASTDTFTTSPKNVQVQKPLCLRSQYVPPAVDNEYWPPAEEKSRIRTSEPGTPLHAGGEILQLESLGRAA
ncbi:hypothetical protein HK104_004945 [Borealophlyctis nickersoniae]|nr:hypothetical protein HK104_004945 [Borealophlyctis nickersoniae]